MSIPARRPPFFANTRISKTPYAMADQDVTPDTITLVYSGQGKHSMGYRRRLVIDRATGWSVLTDSRWDTMEDFPEIGWYADYTVRLNPAQTRQVQADWYRTDLTDGTIVSK